MCREGLRLGKDGKTCEDVDECAEGTAKCESGCRNLDPRTTGMPYVCSCPDGPGRRPRRSVPLRQRGALASAPACRVYDIQNFWEAASLSYQS